MSIVSETIEILRILRRPRVLVGMFGLTLLWVGFTILLFDAQIIPNSLFNFFTIRDEIGIVRAINWSRVVGLLFVLVGGTAFLWYFYRTIDRTASSTDERELNQTALEIRNLRNEFSKFKSRGSDVSNIESQIQEVIRSQKAVNVFDLNELGDEAWMKILFAGRERLIRETSRLSARSRLNLTWGVLISSLAVAYLSYFVFFGKSLVGNQEPYAFFAYYGPRLSLILIVQILASFFLRMYVGNEKTIQRNKNEITNLELRIAAGLMVVSSTHKAKIAQILVGEERNFVLDKREKASSLQGTKETSEILKSLKELIKSLKP